jgi:predicted kinase
MLIVMAGLPCSGKSIMAADLGRALKCAVLGVDEVEAAIWRAGVSPSEPTHHAAYLVVARLAAGQLAMGHDVIVDAVNGPEMARAQWRDLAEQMHATLKFIVVECSDDDIFRDRVEHRSRDVDGFFPEPTWDGVLRRRAEGIGKLPQQRVAVVEIGADHHMRVVKLPRHQPAVVPPLAHPLWRGVTDASQGLDDACYVTHLHEGGPPAFRDHDLAIHVY